jgi:hypothetical protein
MPVLVLLHSPENAITYWIEARQVLRSPELSALSYIGISKSNRLSGSHSGTIVFYHRSGITSSDVDRASSVLVSANPNLKRILKRILSTVLL